MGEEKKKGLLEEKWWHVKMKDSVLKRKKDELHPSAKVIYAFLLVKTGSRNITKMSRKSICEYTGVSKNTVTKYIKELEKSNLLMVEERYKKTNIYIPKKVKEGELDYTRILRSFILSKRFTHTEKIILISLSPYVMEAKHRGEDGQYVMYSYQEIAERTGLSRRYIADNIVSLYEGNGERNAVISRIGSALKFNVDEFMYIGQQDLSDAIEEISKLKAIIEESVEQEPSKIIDRIADSEKENDSKYK